MRRVNPLRAILLALAALVATTLGAGAGAASDDQAIVDAAMDSFNERMIEAGFSSEGPNVVSAGVDEHEAAVIESDCMRATGLDVPGPGPLPGQTASAASDTLTFEPEPSVPTTEPHDDAPTPPAEGETMIALVISVDEAHLADLDGYFDYIASEERNACFEAFEQDALASTPGTAPESEFAVEIVESDLGLGDRSVLIGMHVVEVGPGELFVFDVQAYYVVSGRSLVMVTHGVTPGGPFLDIDVEAELQRILDSL